MSVSPLRLAINVRSGQPAIEAAWDELREFLATRTGVEVVAIDRGDGLDYQSLQPHLVIVLGGDGAILRACRQMGSQQSPILGVNLGRLGFLADLSPQEFVASFPEIEAGQYRIVSHLMFQCELWRAGALIESHLGLNEVILSSGGALKMIEIQLTIDDEPVTTYSGDGLILSTPVGSTAHSLSAGGPILRQDLQAFVLTPICPHTLTVRPVVESADRTYTLSLSDSPTGTTLVIDGQLRIPILSGDQIRVRRAPVSFQMVKVASVSYYGTLHRKLGWAGQPHYRRT